MTNILVFGYYNKENWGDDVFEYVFKNHILKDSKYNVIFKNLDNLNDNTQVYKNVDKVIIGGGDVINEYFFNNESIQKFKEYFDGKPIYFVGVGLTYPDAIKVMDFGDCFFIRNKKDYKIVKDRYNDKSTYVIPDIAFNLLNELKDVDISKTPNTVKNIGISLPNTWLSKGKIFNKKLLSNICEIIKNLSVNYNVHLIPFDTSKNPDNSDVNLLDNIKKCLGDLEKVKYVQKQSTYEMIEYYKNLDIVIGGRFHSIILSIITQTPFISLYASSKIENLKSDLLLESSSFNNLFTKLKIDNDDLPMTIDEQDLLNKLEYINNNYNNITDLLSKVNTKNLIKINKFNTTFQAILDTDPQFRLSPPQFISKTEKDKIIMTTIVNILQKVTNNVSLNDIDNILKGESIRSILPRMRPNMLETFKKFMTEEILWNITGDPYAAYYYGLYDNILNTTFLDQLNWIIDDYYQNFYYKQSNKASISIINKNFQQLHRSGWQYIVDNIVLQLNTDNINKPLIIDTYIDKTFHWNKQFYQSKNIIPYKKDWVGFIHHTYSEYNNTFNCIELFKDKIFIESLKTCKCLIVMTSYLTSKIKESLEKLNIKNVEVFTIIHPTEDTIINFEWDLFMNNKNKQLVNIGNWLRNMFSIYKLDLPENSIIKSKSILKNKNSENYFPPRDLLDNLKDFLIQDNNSNSQIICRNAFSNMHMKGLFECINDMEKSVNELEFLDNDKYDKLLSKNVIFLHLVDASAINTLMECITRNTPILVNRIDPVVEILGEDYPLYYNTLYEASKLLENEENIKAAHEYIKNMDKKTYNISEFITKLTFILNKYCC
jgi:polysaccharide pyruvyl transferase WcaK-like protein